MKLAQKSGSATVAAVAVALAVLVSGVGPSRAGDSQLVEQGRDLFMNETFGGNGRTCATCHPPTNNFTLDPIFIEGLPDDDPLFVAEFDPNLSQLEDPELMRRFALILENVDGFDRPGVFRGVPHTLGLPMSIKVDPEGSDNLTRADGSTVAEATGWSGDGAPGGGSLREFAIGAITQHFPKTLNRIEGQDFRLPTDAELDALEAFQLSLGRQVELDLATMDFDDPDVQMGKDLFNGVGINRACSNCHNNAGANNSDGFNNNFGTNAASLLNTPARQFDPAIPGDGGFDSGPEFEIAGIGAEFYGNGSMNSASLVEAADTGPFFHNNSAATIEDAVRFYTTETFSDDNAFQLDDAQINQVAAFLRTINTLENARNAIVLAEDAQREPAERARETIEVVIADTEDAIEVMDGGPLAPLDADVIADLEDALVLAEDAYDAEEPALRNATLQQAIALLNGIPGLILEPDEEPEVANSGGDQPPTDQAGNGVDGDQPPTDQAGNGGDGDQPPTDQAGNSADGDQPPTDQAGNGVDGDQPPTDQAGNGGDGDQPPTDQAGNGGDGDQPATDQAGNGGDGDQPPADQAVDDGDGDQPPADQAANGDGDRPPADQAVDDGDGDQPPADQAANGGDGDRFEEEREVASAG
jgi:cytochrome c peroxidase